MGIFSLHAISHWIPGGALFLFGVAALALSIARSHSLLHGQSLCQVHVPERNMILLERVAWVVIIVVFCVGMPLEGQMSCNGHWFRVFDSCFYDNRTIFHNTLYLMYGANAFIGLLEARGRLPPDSYRLFFTFIFLILSVMWSGHASMKKSDNVDARLHYLLALLSFMHALVALYSVLKPSNVVAYLAVWGMFVLRGIWLVTIGLDVYLGITKTNQVDSLFGSEMVLVTTVIVVVITLLGSPTIWHEAQVSPPAETESCNSDAKSPGNKEYQELLRLVGDQEEPDSGIV